MIDDGEWAGVPIGGLGAGSIGRTFRGDFARWHLEVGKHVFRPSPVDGLRSTSVGPMARPRRTTLLSGASAGGLPAAVASLPVGRGTYHALFPRAWQTFEPDELGGPRRRRAAEPGYRRRPRVERAAARRLRLVDREPGPGVADGRRCS